MVEAFWFVLLCGGRLPRECAGSNISSTGSVPTYEGSSPAHQGKIRSNFNIGKRFEFDQTYYYVSALPAQNVRAYQTMDGRFQWNIRKEFSFSVVGQNLFQPDHYEWVRAIPLSL